VKKALLETILDTVRRFDLLSPCDRVLLAVSGGGDSVFLLHALLELRTHFDLTLAVAHLNHGIRGEEGDADESYVRKLARRHSLDFFSRREDVPAYSTEHGIGVEEAGRILRYAFFDECLRSWKGTRIATGHTRTDSAETIFLNLLRGSGPRGLSGIPPRRDAIIRPLIALNRDEIASELERQGIDYKTDKTNLVVSFKRNFIRNVVFPELERGFPGFEERVARTAEMLREESDFLETWVDRELGKVWKRAPEGEVILDRSRVLSYHSSVRKWMFHRLLDVGYEGSRSLDEVLERGGRLSLPDGWKIEVSEGDVRLHRFERTWKRVLDLAIGETVRIPELNLRIRASRVKTRRSGTPFLAYISLRRARGRLRVRSRRQGDGIEIPGIGRKSLKKLFIDRKIPRWRRGLSPLILSGDTVLWAVGVQKGFREDVRANEYVKLEVKRLDDGEFWIYDP
jgi:tRNA(Ile)-lysidine synthase